MADQLISDAVATPQDEGYPSLTDGEDETYNSAGAVAAMARAVASDSYVASDSELGFESHDGTNDTVDVTAGIAYLSLDGETVSIQSGTGSDSSTPAYDTDLPSGEMVMVVVPSTISGVALQDSTLSDVWLAYDTDGTGPAGDAGSVYVRSDDTGSVTAPSHPSVKLGEANPDDASADVLSNRGPSPTFESLNTANLNTVRNAAEFADNGADGIQAAIDDAPTGGEVWVPEGGGGGSNGEYIVDDPGSAGVGISVAGKTLRGIGNPVIKLDDSSDVNHDRIIEVGSGDVIGLTIDGNRSNQTEDDSVENQAGVGGTSDGATVRDCTVQNVQHRSIYFIDASDVTVENNDITNGGGRAIQIKNTGTQGNVRNFRSVGNDIRSMSPSTTSNGIGVVFGNKVEDCVDDSHIDHTGVSGTNDAFLAESSSQCHARGTYVNGPVRFVTQNESSFTGVCEGAPIKISSCQAGVHIGGMSVGSNSHGVHGDARSQQAHITTTIRNPTTDGVRLEGFDRGAHVDVAVADTQSSGGYGVLIQADSGTTTDCANVNISASVYGAFDYAVGAADASQTGLVDGVTATGTNTGTVDDPGGLTVGDTL